MPDGVALQLRVTLHFHLFENAGAVTALADAARAHRIRRRLVDLAEVGSRCVGVRLLAQKQAAALAATMKRLRADALIAWKDRALKAAYEALPIAQ